MKITNDVNNNANFLSVSNKGDEDETLLGSLFSANFISNEIKSNNISDDSEFTFKEEDKEIIDYLSNYFLNLKFPNLDSSDFKRIKNKIQSDESIKTETKDKILDLLESTKDFNKNFFIKLPEYHKFKSVNNKNIFDYKGNNKNINESSKSLASFIKKKENVVDQSGDKSIKSSVIKKNTNQIFNSDHMSDNQTRLISNNKTLNFVKKIKKNNHPNKLYKICKSASFNYI